MNRLLLGIALLALSLGAEPAADPPTWHLVWADNFSTDGAPNSSKWTYERGYIRNHEAQFYTEARRENARIEDGHLIIQARHDELPLPNGKVAPITSAAIETRDKASWKYGRIEVRAKIPRGRGTWPAIWMMPQDDSAGWPACGEIDIMENVGFEPNLIHQTIHTKAANWPHHNAHTTITPVSNLADGYHTYTMQWDADSMQMFIDDQKTFEFANPHTGKAEWPFDKPFYLILNLAIGGEWGAQKGIDPHLLPCQMDVNWVHVYQPE
jgi:beta-glucanase (GH16 family)